MPIMGAHWSEMLSKYCSPILEYTRGWSARLLKAPQHLTHQYEVVFRKSVSGTWTRNVLQVLEGSCSVQEA